MKTCSNCHESKSLVEFYKRKTGIRTGELYEKCKQCMKERGRLYYSINIERQRELAKERKKKYALERKKFIHSLKKKPCMDCGKIYPPWVMDFDHRVGTIKLGSLGSIYKSKLWTFEKIKIEIEKCDLVCANCHRQRTYERLHGSAYAKIA